MSVWAPDCDCDAMTKIAKTPIAVRRFQTDAEAIHFYKTLGPRLIGTIAIHGPSGHLLAVDDQGW